MKNKNIAGPVVFGSLALDTLITPAGKREELLGGSATYAALGACFFSNPVILSCVGEDFPSVYREEMENKGISFEGVEVKEGKTFRWVAEYGENPQDLRVISTCENVLGNYSPCLPSSLKKRKFLLLANNAPLLQKEVLSQMEDSPFVVWDTMKYWIENYREDVEEMLNVVDLVIINDEEARILSGKRNLFKAVDSLFNQGVSRIIIKKGEHGSIYCSSDDSLFLLPAYPVKECLDPTGAGDTFAGALTGYLEREGISTDSLKQALLYATIIASFTVEGWGVERLLRLSEEVIEKRAEDFYKWIHI